MVFESGLRAGPVVFERQGSGGGGGKVLVEVKKEAFKGA